MAVFDPVFFAKCIFYIGHVQGEKVSAQFFAFSPPKMTVFSNHLSEKTETEPQIRIFNNPSLRFRQSEPQTRKIDYPSKKVNLRGLKSGNRFQFFFRTHKTC